MGKITVENLKFIFENVKWEQELLFKQISEYAKRDITYIKLMLGLYGVFIPIITTLILYSARSGNTLDITLSPTREIFSGILLVVGFLSLGLLRFILTSKTGSLKVIRQINCNRQLLQTIYMTLIDDVNISDESDYVAYLNKGKTTYYDLIGRHVRLPSTNSSLRNSHCNIFKSYLSSSDGILSIITSTITIFSIFLGSAGLFRGVIPNNALFYVVTGFFMFVTVAFIFIMLITSWLSIRNAVQCPAGSNLTSSCNS